MKKEEIVLDCRELEPPEPMNLVIGSLPKLDSSHVIVMLHRMVPALLLPILKENGYHYRIDELPNGEVKVTIWWEN